MSQVNPAFALTGNSEEFVTFVGDSWSTSGISSLDSLNSLIISDGESSSSDLWSKSSLSWLSSSSWSLKSKWSI